MKQFVSVIALLLLVGCIDGAANRTRPVVLMHGLLATAEAMDHIEGWLKADFPGIYVHNAEIGHKDPKLDSLFISMNDQLSMFAQQLAADPNLADGFDLIGHSQGALLTRSYLERYQNHKVHNYISGRTT